MLCKQCYTMRLRLVLCTKKGLLPSSHSFKWPWSSPKNGTLITALLYGKPRGTHKVTSLRRLAFFWIGWFIGPDQSEFKQTKTTGKYLKWQKYQWSWGNVSLYKNQRRVFIVTDKRLQCGTGESTQCSPTTLHSRQSSYNAQLHLVYALWGCSCFKCLDTRPQGLKAAFGLGVSRSLRTVRACHTMAAWLPSTAPSLWSVKRKRPSESHLKPNYVDLSTAFSKQGQRHEYSRSQLKASCEGQGKKRQSGRWLMNL